MIQKWLNRVHIQKFAQVRFVRYVQVKNNVQLGIIDETAFQSG